MKPISQESTLPELQLVMATLAATSHVVVQKIIEKEKREPAAGDLVRFQSEMIELLAAKYEVSVTEEEVAQATLVLAGVFAISNAQSEGR